MIIEKMVGHFITGPWGVRINQTKTTLHTETGDKFSVQKDCLPLSQKKLAS